MAYIRLQLFWQFEHSSTPRIRHKRPRLERNCSRSRQGLVAKLVQDAGEAKRRQYAAKSAGRQKREFRHLVRACQREEFGEDIDRLTKERPLNRSSKLIQLSPFLYKYNVLRLGDPTSTIGEDSDSSTQRISSRRNRLSPLKSKTTLLDTAWTRAGQKDAIQMYNLRQDARQAGHAEDGRSTGRPS